MIILGILKINRKRIKMNQIIRMSENSRFFSNLVRNNFFLLFSTKRNEKDFFFKKYFLYKLCNFIGIIRK